MNGNYQLGLLYLTHLLVGVDGDINENELRAFSKIRQVENITNEVFKQFEQEVLGLKEREIYQAGIDLINQCTDEEKLKALVTLYKMSEVDGRVHSKEIRLLLYSIKNAGIEFEDVVLAAKTTSSIL